MPQALCQWHTISCATGTLQHPGSTLTASKCIQGTYIKCVLYTTGTVCCRHGPSHMGTMEVGAESVFSTK
eukprot:15328225-Ditylum_brightwellii.AAC.1